MHAGLATLTLSKPISLDCVPPGLHDANVVPNLLAQEDSTLRHPGSQAEIHFRNNVLSHIEKEMVKGEYVGARR